MDRGAHFFRCDLQVHTPRDHAWKGSVPVSDAERRAYADALVAACRQKQLDAIAITDHHDMAFIPYVRAAALEERDSNGALLPADKRLVVFPGVELTLAVPCQALLILDADFPEELFELVLTTLTITPEPPSSPKGPQVEPLPFNSLSEVVAVLDKQSHIRGRYILLPNVTDSGTKTLLRKGMAPKYASMPCVGGYVDGEIMKLGEGNRRILEGLDRSWGNKAIAVFQTSDSRREDHQDLGRAPTWIKWAVPTAEALRQACLARQTRVSVREPFLPSAYIRSVSISNSRFLGPLNLELNPQYSAFIGGRGTGKSTVLEYVRWALCDQPVSPSESDEVPDYASRRESLISKTLRPLNSVVEVRFVANGVEHVVRRDSADGRVFLKIGSGEFKLSSDTEIRRLLPIQAYSQKQLSSVAVRVDELTRFLEAPGKAELDAIDQRFNQLAAQIRELHAARLQQRLLGRTISEKLRELESLRQQAEAIRAALTGLNASDQAVIAQIGSYQAANEYVNRILGDIDEVSDVLGQLEEKLRTLPRPGEQPPEFQESPLIQAIETEATTLLSALREKVTEWRQHVAPGERAALSTRVAEWNTAYNEFMVKYEAAKNASQSHESRLAELSTIEGRISELATAVDRAQRELELLGDPQARYEASWQEWKDLHRDRLEVLERLAANLAGLSGGLIRVSLIAGGDQSELVNRLKLVTQGSGIHTSRLEDLVKAVAAESDILEAWFSLVHELENVALWDPLATPEAPACPAIVGVGIGEAQIRRLGERLTADRWLDFALQPLRIVPVFEFRAKENEYIPFADASAGQQATALIRALLSQEGPPLLIDQPEDDLDNQVVLEVAGDIWKAKTRRQLIFASHNANLVVNGDADLVVAFGYRVAGDASGGRIVAEGAIDVPETNDVIKRIMEGGEEAFKMRQAKYGF